MKEIFKPIKGYEGLYEISNLGNVKSLSRNGKGIGKGKSRKETILKPQKNNVGYLFVCLCKNGIQKNFTIHRLVAEAFIPNPNNYTEVNHKDENKTNNYIDNLEWCTHKYNLNYGNYNKNMSIIKYGKHSGWGKSIFQYSKDGKLIKVYKTMTEAAKSIGKDFNSFRGSVNRLIKGESKKGLAYGFVWKFQ